MNTLKKAAVTVLLAFSGMGLAEAHHADNSQFNANKNLVFTAC